MRAIFFGALLLATSCRGAPSSRPTSDSSQYLRAFGQCAIATYATFQAAADSLAAATAKLDAEPTAANVASSRAAWTTAIDAWEQVIPMKIGPLSPTALPGGKGLDDAIYAWTIVNRCRIDELTLDGAYTSIAGALPDRRGLAALEYLLFYEGSDNGCGSTHPMNVSGTWAASETSAIAARRRAYAKVVARDVSETMRTVVEAWDPARGNFLGVLVDAGRGSGVYRTDAAAVNAVSDAMFSIDSDTKDKKLAVPLALKGCPTATCPEAVESKFAKRSRLHIRNNLVGFRKLFTGCGADFAGVGFDDLLTARGAASLGRAIDVDVVAAIAAVDALPGETLEEALAKDPGAVRRLYDSIKRITDTLKTDFVSVLNLELPKQVAGDAD